MEETMQTENYISESLALHLFFGRIMKEHSLFLKAGFTPACSNFSARAEFYKQEFEKLLERTVALSNGTINKDVLHSGEIVTEFTIEAERQTERFTGISINRNITQRELKLNHCNCCKMPNLFQQVKNLNRTACRLLDGLIALKEEVLAKVCCCQIFTMSYPLLIEHIIREAKLYKKYIDELENNGTLCMESMKETECFWNQIMMEHALFIRGLLDPTETELLHSADGFAQNYAALLRNCHSTQNKMLSANTLTETKKFRDFKIAGVEGIENCKIRSLILPLLADHVLREANHFIRILEN